MTAASNSEARKRAAETAGTSDPGALAEEIVNVVLSCVGQGDPHAEVTRIIAARIVQARAGEGALRQRVERVVRSPQADLFRDEACRHAVKQPYADNRYVRLLDDLRAILATEDDA